MAGSRQINYYSIWFNIKFNNKIHWWSAKILEWKKYNTQYNNTNSNHNNDNNSNNNNKNDSNNTNNNGNRKTGNKKDDKN